jgi:phosphoserine phosphatase RsbX
VSQAVIEFGQAQRALPGQAESGDRCVVKLLERRVLLGVIDGLGHGSEAARTAAAAAEVLDSFAGEPVDSLITRCHDRLLATRGAAMTLVGIDHGLGLLQWVGAGNVAAVLVREEPFGQPKRHELFVRGGLVGASLPVTDVSTMPIAGGDVLALATDGLHPDFVDRINTRDPPQQQADRLLAEFHTRHDDGMIVVARLQACVA